LEEAEFTYLQPNYGPEANSGIFLGLKGWQARKADNLTAICQRID
jgi:hypothetical protein